MGDVELFAGPGGFSEGYRLAGIGDDLTGYEWDTPACATAIAAGHKREQADVAAVEVPDSFRGLIASPPCQGFSPAGARRGIGDSPKILAAVADMDAHRAGFDLILRTLDDACEDHRSSLVLQPLRWALLGRPAWMAWEQVPTVLPLWQACAAVLERRGYSVWTGMLQAEAYGVPQTRKRAILIANRFREVGEPVRTHSRYYSHDPKRLDSGVPSWVSMATALGWEMTERPSMTVTGDGTYTGGAEPFGNEARKSMRREIDAGRWLFAGAGATSQHTAGQVPRELDLPAHTILGRGSAAWMDGEKHVRRVTIEEAAALQSFRDGYPFQGNLGQRYRQVGDAVPPLLARRVLEAVAH